ncbi:IS3 family transposase [Methylovulum psychrotolerans]|uniref:IS3 family transposase n=3 Tax=Methylovulum psychrotolerans TaxID=1704499 RepID=UPI003D15F2D0
MSEKKRKLMTGAQKAKVALEAVKGTKTANEIAQEHGVHPTQVGLWKKALLENAGQLFETKRGPKAVDPQSDPERLYAKIGQLNMELDWLKKKFRDQPLSLRQAWVAPNDGQLPVTAQCRLAGIARSTVYAGKAERVDGFELMLLRLLDEEYTRRPFYGSRKMVAWLRAEGHCVNRKRVQRLMHILGLAGMAPGPNTSKSHPAHAVYPYLLRGLGIVRPNHVWSTDITYIRLAHGFVYLVAVIDWYSRKVLAWEVSNTMDVGFCVDCLATALRLYGIPEIFNTDQGAQFTSDKWIAVLKDNGITISMDGRGRALDNIFVERLWRSVKHEDVYLKGYAHLPELLSGLADYFVFYNSGRYHQSLGYKTPDEVYRTAVGGGAKIADHFSDKRNASNGETGQRQSAAMAMTLS